MRDGLVVGIDALLRFAIVEADVQVVLVSPLVLDDALAAVAQTPEGVTGFMVDRHAEGLKVGADEKKTGQRGSPTRISLCS